MRTVYCVGGIRDDQPEADIARPGCGWRGERYTLNHDRYLPPAYNHQLNPLWVQAVTAKPCPRCGGTVAPIEAGDP